MFTKESDESPTPVNIFEGEEKDKLTSLVIDEEMVLGKLKKLREDKSTGVDNLSPRLLVGIGEAIVKPVTIIFNKTLDMSKVPDDWRRANVTPIYKKGSRTKPENYRPVSLTSQICKLFESIVKEAIVEHLEKFRLR